MKKQWLALAGLLVIATVIIIAVALTLRPPQRRQVTIPPLPPKPSRLLDRATSRPTSAVDLTITFADDIAPPPRTRFMLKKPIRSVAGLPEPGELATLAPGLNRLDLADFPDGDHHLYIVADGHAPQWRRIVVRDKQIVEGAANDVTLYPTKYIIIRWAFNTTGKPELTGPDVVVGRTAVTHFALPRYFGADWQVWQSGPKGKPSFGDIPMLAFHRHARDMGFCSAPDGATFDDLTTAPPLDQFTPKAIEATPGLLLYCRVSGNSPAPGDRGFGKILVESVTTNRPTGIEIREPTYP